MRRALRSPPRRELLAAGCWALLFGGLLGLRLALPPARTGSLRWLELGAAALLLLLVLAAALGRRSPAVGAVVLRIEQAAVFIAITRLLGLGSQPDPGRREQLLIALLAVHAVGAIVVSDELPRGSRSWRTALWALALSFGALTATVLGT